MPIAGPRLDIDEFRALPADVQSAIILGFGGADNLAGTVLEGTEFDTAPDVFEPFTGPGSNEGTRGSPVSDEPRIISRSIAKFTAPEPSTRLAGGAFTPVSVPSLPDDLFQPTDETGVDVAAGQDLLERQFAMLIQAAQEARAQREQNLGFASFFTELMNADPVSALNLRHLITGAPANPLLPFIHGLVQGDVSPSFGGIAPTALTDIGGVRTRVPTNVTGQQLARIREDEGAMRVLGGLERLTGIDILGASARQAIPGGVLPGVVV